MASSSQQFVTTLAVERLVSKTRLPVWYSTTWILWVSESKKFSFHRVTTDIAELLGGFSYLTTI